MNGEEYPSVSATGLFRAVQTSPKSRKNLYYSAISDSCVVHANLPLPEFKRKLVLRVSDADGQGCARSGGEG